MHLSVSALTRTGLVRTQNEDALLVSGWVSATDTEWSVDRAIGENDQLLVAVFDGMGGHQGGAVASRLAATVLGHACIDGPDALRRGLVMAHRSVNGASQSVRGLAQMGTTAVAALVDSSSVTISHVGDSSAFRLMNGALGLLTEPHRVPDSLNQGATVLTQCLGVGGDPQPSLDTYRIRRPMRILLCSDGLTDLVPDANIRNLLAEADLSSAAETLVDAAYAHGADDNVSVIVLDLDPDDSAKA